MDDDDELCLCFHVTKRKVVHFLRVERPQRVSQLSSCQGAGTGCGWCRKLLVELFASQGNPTPDLPSAKQHVSARAAYLQAGKGQPPAAADESAG